VVVGSAEMAVVGEMAALGCRAFGLIVLFMIPLSIIVRMSSSLESTFRDTDVSSQRELSHEVGHAR
jgi:hypothetical protein